MIMIAGWGVSRVAAASMTVTAVAVEMRSGAQSSAFCIAQWQSWGLLTAPILTATATTLIS